MGLPGKVSHGGLPPVLAASSVVTEWPDWTPGRLPTSRRRRSPARRGCAISWGWALLLSVWGSLISPVHSSTPRAPFPPFLSASPSPARWGSEDRQRPGLPNVRHYQRHSYLSRFSPGVGPGRRLRTSKLPVRRFRPGSRQTIGLRPENMDTACGNPGRLGCLDRTGRLPARRSVSGSWSCVG